MKYCTKCGASVSNNAKFCNKCGNPINLDNKNVEQDSKELNNNSYKTEALNSRVREKADDIDDTVKINMNKDIPNNTKRNLEAESKNNGNGTINPNKPKKSILSGVMPKVLIGLVVVGGILCGVFFNKISSKYYIMKCNNSFSGDEKVTYAAKAVKADDNDETMELLKNALINLSKNDLDLAEEKLKSLSDILNEDDIKNISIAIKEKKVENFCGLSNYEAAMAEFEELDKLGVDFKKNKNYDDVMLHIASKITGCSVKTNKNALMENEAVYYDNLDDDIFDEIIEVKSGRSYEDLLKVNLYKFIDGKYKLVDTKIINNSTNKGIQGVYNYKGDQKGVYVSYQSTLGRTTYATAVYGVEDSRLVLKGIVYGNNYTKVEDTNGDGVYEVISSSTTGSGYSSSRKEVIKSYAINDEGRTPTELSSSGNDSNNDADSAEGYIFPDSDKTYLTEDDLIGVSKEKLALARNEIFARHGYVFKEEPFKTYFKNKNWYTPNPNYDGSDTILNNYETANYQVIQSWEKR